MPATTFQYAPPTSIQGVTAWAGSVSSVDEPPPFNDSDIMTSPVNSPGTGLSFPIRFNLVSAINPLYTADGWSILVRAAKNSAANSQVLLAELFDDNLSSLIASFPFTLSTSATDYSYNLTSTEAANISAIAITSGLWSLQLTAQMPIGVGNNFVVLSGCCLQLPALGFSHLVSSTSGYKIEGAHSGHNLKPRTGGAGYLVGAGSESSGCLIPSANGLIKVKQ
jgi:hypothetical protein